MGSEESPSQRPPSERRAALAAIGDMRRRLSEAELPLPLYKNARPDPRIAIPSSWDPEPEADISEPMSSAELGRGDESGE